MAVERANISRRRLHMMRSAALPVLPSVLNPCVVQSLQEKPFTVGLVEDTVVGRKAIDKRKRPFDRLTESTVGSHTWFVMDSGNTLI